MCGIVAAFAMFGSAFTPHAPESRSCAESKVEWNAFPLTSEVPKSPVKHVTVVLLTWQPPAISAGDEAVAEDDERARLDHVRRAGRLDHEHARRLVVGDLDVERREQRRLAVLARDVRVRDGALARRAGVQRDHPVVAGLDVGSRRRRRDELRPRRDVFCGPDGAIVPVADEAVLEDDRVRVRCPAA